ncbi:MAG: ATPase [Bacteroidetes bacterium]|nr:ATPase [Bacteroidota bacterium]
MKKLAMPVENGKLSHHFGHSREFMFFEIENNKVISRVSKEPPPHAEGTIPRWLIAEKVTDLLVGGIGPKAIDILNSAAIDVCIGVEVDTPENIANSYIVGSLKYGQNYCHH